MHNRIIVGVVGQIASGKGIMVEYLKEKFGFNSYSLSSVVHDELKKRQIKEFTRKTLQDIGDKLRKQYGNDVLAKRISNRSNWSNKSNKTNLIILEGIRNPAEIEFLKKNPEFILIGIKANRKLRFERLLHRKKSWDPKSYQEFMVVDRRDLGVGQDKNGQQVGKCLAYCDYVLTNNKSIEDFQRKIEKFMYKILQKG